MCDNTIDIALEKRKILEQALEVVQFEGWNIELMEQLSLTIGEDVFYVESLFGSLENMVEYYFEYLDQLMLDYAESETTLLGERTREIVEDLIKFRLSKINPLVAGKTAEFLFRPKLVPLLVKTLYKTSDLIWNIVEQKEKDFSFYSKRSITMLVYSSTILYYIHDESNEHNKTYKFLNKRIGNIITITKLKNATKQNMSAIVKNLPFFRCCNF